MNEMGSFSRHDSGAGGGPSSSGDLDDRIARINRVTGEKITVVNSLAKGCSFFLPGPLRRVLFSIVGGVATQITIDERSSLGDSRDQLGDSGVLRHNR